MPSIDTDPQSLRDVRAALQRCQTDIERSVNQVRGVLRSAHWNDDRRKQFEQELETLLRSLSSFGRQADEMKSYLARKADELDRFLQR